MKLQEGQPAIDFNAEDIYGNKVQLSDYKGKKIILGFHRHMSCPFCNRRVHQLMGKNLRLQKSGVQIILLFESDNEKLKESVFHKGIQPWPLIGDPQRKLYDIYGIERSTLKLMKTMVASNPFKAMKETKDLNLPEYSGGSMNLIPADFFINENFTIEKAHYGSHADDHVDMSLLEEFAGIRR
jgi:peroxiredoxin